MNILTDLRNDIRGFVMPLLGKEMPLAVTETIEALWNDNLRPQIHAKQKTANGYTFVIALPAGVSFKDFYAKRDYFKDHAGGDKVNVSISQRGKMAILEITTNILKDYFDFTLDYPIKGELPIPIGYSTNGLQLIDLSKHEHILIGGETGSGKTTCLNVIIVSLLSLPTPPILIVIDLKKSGDYSYLDDRALLITDRDIACQALDRLMQEMQVRQQILYDAKCKDIQRFHKYGGKMPWIVLIIDELAQLKNKYAQETLEDLSALSRASGFRLICATQRPSSKIFQSKSFGDAKANFTITVCYRTRSAVDSRVILGTGEGAKIPKIPGRGLLQIGCDLIEIQTPYIDPEAIPYVDKFTPDVFREEYKTNSAIDRLGSIGHTTDSTPFVSFLPGSTSAASGAGRCRKNKT